VKIYLITKEISNLHLINNFPGKYID